MHNGKLLLFKRNYSSCTEKNLGQIVAVGTTSVRTLESLYYIGLHLSK